MSGGHAEEIRAGYEALRAAATGHVPCGTPRGLSVLVDQGLPAWMRAWVPLPSPRPVAEVDQRPLSLGIGTEVVRVLTEMALGCSSTLAAS